MSEAEARSKLPANVFKEGVDANLIAPQNMLVTAVTLTNEALKSLDFDPRILAHARADKEQVDWLGEIMDRAHLSRDIPVATKEGVSKLQRALDEKLGPGKTRVRALPEERLKGLWRGYQENALGILAALAGLRNAGGHIISRSEIGVSTSGFLAGELHRVLLNPQVRTRVTRAFSAFNQFSLSERGKELAALIRELNDYSTGQPTPTEKDERNRAKRLAVREVFNEMFVNFINEERKLGNPPCLTLAEIEDLAFSYAR